MVESVRVISDLESRILGTHDDSDTVTLDPVGK